MAEQSLINTISNLSSNCNVTAVNNLSSIQQPIKKCISTPIVFWANQISCPYRYTSPQLPATSFPGCSRLDPQNWTLFKRNSNGRLLCRVNLITRRGKSMGTRLNSRLPLSGKTHSFSWCSALQKKISLRSITLFKATVQMAFSPEDFLRENIFVDCRATLFCYESAIWRPCFSEYEGYEAQGISRIQLVCQRSFSGNVCRIYGRWKTSGHVS